MWTVAIIFTSFVLVDAGSVTNPSDSVFRPIIDEIFPDLSTKTTAELGGLDELINILYEVHVKCLELKGPNFKPCPTPIIVGGIRFLLNYEELHDTMSDILELVEMETGDQIQIDQTKLKALHYVITQPLHHAMDRLECEIGLISCSEHHTETTPSLKMWNEIHKFFRGVDFQHTTVAYIIAGMLDATFQWYKENLTADMRLLCAQVNDTVDVIQTALTKIKKTKDKDLFDKVKEVYPDNAEEIAYFLKKAKFVENAPVVLALNSVMSHGDFSFLAMRATLYGMMYEVESGENDLTIGLVTRSEQTYM